MTRKPKTAKREITLIIYENCSFYIKTVIFTIKLFVLSLRINMAMSCPNMGDTPFLIKTRMNCFRYLKLMSPLNAAICTTTYLERQKCYGPGKKILFKKQLFYPEVKGQGPTKVITVCDTPPYGHAPTYQKSLTYLKRQKCYGPDKKILFKKQLFDLEVKVPRRSLQYATHRLMVMHPPTK
jgi:hypothetical protein